MRPVSLLALTLALTLSPLATHAAPQPPNILFIFSDDHALAAISAYGDARKLVQTPNIDRLAHEGMIFHRAMVPNSICGPSRATVLTGKYSHANGFYDNMRSRFDGSQPTLPKLLKAAGYQTAVIGKWHLVSDPTGFDHWEILPGQGVYYNPPMLRLRPTQVGTQSPASPPTSPSNSQRVQHQGYVTDIITDLSLDWLKNRDKSKPFLLMAQHKAPHREWSPNVKNLGWNGDRQFPEPDSLFDDYAGRGKAEHEQDMTLAKTFTPLDAKLRTPAGLTGDQLKLWNAYYEPRNDAFRKANPQGKDLVRWRYQRYLHDYLGTVLSVDESVGRLLKYLDDEGLAQNTIVVYSSDQGFYLGEHGWFDKRWIFEESLRTPLLIRWPGQTKPGSSNKDLVSNLDFASTFLEAAGRPIPGDIQGRSLVPLLQGRTPADWRKSFYYHYYEYPGAHSVRRHYGVVTDRFKLVHFYEPDVNYWELFDLQTDPKELRSVYGQPAYTARQQELHAELQRLRAQLKVPAQDPPESRPLPAKKTAQPEFSDVFLAGKDGFKSIRIPSVVVTSKGTVLAVAEGRAQNADQANNKLILKRSLDGGKTWGPRQLIADDGANTLNNPCMVVDGKTTRVILMYQSYPAGLSERDGKIKPGLEGPAIVRNYVIHSDDDGVTWSKPLDVTRTTKTPERVTILASGPGIGIQLRHGPHAGRLIIPFNEGPFGQWNVLAVYSDNGGKDWRLGQPAPGCRVPDGKGGEISLVNEVQMVELADGSVLLNSRKWGGKALRKVAVSRDGGLTWSKIEEDPALRDPGCMASVFRYSFPSSSSKSILLYSGPDSTKRDTGTVYLSSDEGKTWPVKKILFPGSFAYSVLTALPDGTIGCLFETDDANRLVFARFTLDWLTAP